MRFSNGPGDFQIRCQPRCSLTSWYRLPVELRFQILELLPLTGRGWAKYSSVCRDWQGTLERENFRTLKVKMSCLDELGSMVGRQQRFVQKLWLQIELREYTCRVCENVPSFHESQVTDRLVGRNISKLFAILSTWDPDCSLTLELSVHSLGDRQHWFKNYLFGADGEEDIRTTRHDIKHFWSQGRQLGLPQEPALLRLFDMLDPRVEGTLPEARVVTRFVIRRQMRKRIVYRTLALMWRSMPRLEEIVYEPWRAWRFHTQDLYDDEYECLIREHLPRNLKKLTLFQGSDINHMVVLQSKQVPPSSIKSLPDHMVSRTMAANSLNLEHLSAASLVEARVFFEACQPDWIWTNLQYLALTSRELIYHVAQDNLTAIRMGELLETAGRVALGMPRLREMILWDVHPCQAGAFIYQRKNKCSEVLWRGSWRYQIPTSVTKAWDKVAKMSGSYGVIERPMELITSSFHSEAVWLALLGLPGPVVDPESLRQMLKEDVWVR